MDDNKIMVEVVPCPGDEAQCDLPISQFQYPAFWDYVFGIDSQCFLQTGSADVLSFYSTVRMDHMRERSRTTAIINSIASAGISSAALRPQTEQIVPVRKAPIGPPPLKPS